MIRNLLLLTFVFMFAGVLQAQHTDAGGGGDSNPSVAVSAARAGRQLTIPADQVKFFAWHSTEGKDAYQSRLNTNLEAFKGINGVSNATFNAETNIITLTMEGSVESVDAIVKEANRVVTLSAFDRGLHK